MGDWLGILHFAFGTVHLALFGVAARVRGVGVQNEKWEMQNEKWARRARRVGLAGGRRVFQGRFGREKLAIDLIRSDILLSPPRMAANRERRLWGEVG